MIISPSLPPDNEALLEGPKNQKLSIFLPFFSIPDLKFSAVLFTVLLIKLMTEQSIHQIFTVYQDIVILLQNTSDQANCLKIQQMFSDILQIVLD